MPLLRKAKFERTPVPKDLNEEEDVFYCSLTDEIFRDYDEFFKRTILLNSLVWTCCATGKMGLTYEEALNSENAARDTLEMMPDFLERPMLYIASFTERGRLDDLVSDVVAYMKERYFIGEVVEVFHNGVKRFGTIIEVNYDMDVKKSKRKQQFNNGASNSHSNQNGDNESDNCSNIEDSATSSSKTPKMDDFGPAPEYFKYVVEIIPSKREEKQILSPEHQSDGIVKRLAVYKHDGIIRRKVVLTKTKCRLFFKNSCDLDNRYFTVKDSAREQYQLDQIQWEHMFAGPIPNFVKSPLLRKSSARSGSPSLTGMPPSSSKNMKRHRGGSPSVSTNKNNNQAGSSCPSSKSSVANAQQQKIANARTQQQKIKKALNDEQEAKQLIAWEKQQQIIGVLITEANSLNLVIHPVVAGSLNSRPGTLVNENIINDMRLKLKQAKEDEKERMREERRQAKAKELEWKRPRDDLECDDHKPLPDFSPVYFPEFLSDSDFGECLVVLEFLNTFREYLENFQETFPDGVTLTYLWKALVSRDPRGPYTELLGYLLNQVFQKQTEEDGDEANLENKEEIQLEGDLDRKFFRTTIQAATLFSEKSRSVHGVSIRFLPLDGYTLTEVLRMYFLSGGYYTGVITSKARLHERGGFKCWDDHALLFRLYNQDIMEALSKSSVFTLSITTKLKLLTVLCDQLLTFSTIRHPLTKTAETLIQLRMELRQLQLMGQKWDKDATIAMYTIQNLSNPPSDLDKSSIGVASPSISLSSINNSLVTSTPKSTNLHNISGKTINFVESTPTLSIPASSDTYMHLSKIFYKDSSKREDLLKKAFEKLNFAQLSSVKEIDDVRRMEKEFVLSLENRIKSDLNQLQTNLGYCLLGQDRSFRKYYLVPCVSAVFVEHDERANLGECEKPTPLNRVQPNSILPKSGSSLNEKFVRQKLLVCTGDPTDCPVHSRSGVNHRRWSLLYNADTLHLLITSLNKRGFRENELCENLTFYKDHLLDDVFKRCDADFFTSNKHQSLKTEIDSDLELTLETDFRDSLLEIEYKIYAGGLGNLNISNRDSWRDAIENKRYDAQCTNLLLNNDETIDLNESVKSEDKIKQMSFALLQVANSVSPKFLKSSFLMQSTDSSTIASADENPTVSDITTFYLWKLSLLKSESWSQLFLHMETFEKNVSWNMSLLTVRCRECRRKGDVDSLVVCCECERPFHVACLKPSSRKLVGQLGAKWACKDCFREEKAKIKVELVSNDLYDAEMSSEENSILDTIEQPVNVSSASSCAVCQKMLLKQARLICINCGNKFHYQCVDVKASSSMDKKNWRCATCLAEDTVTASGRSSNVEIAANNNATANSAKSTRTGRMVKRPVSFEEMEFAKKSVESKNALSRTSSASSSSFLNGSRDDETSDLAEPVTKKGRHGRFSFERKGETCKYEQLLKMAIRHSDAWPFLKPVSRKDAPDYYVHIKRPMDLQTIRSKVDIGKYDNEFDFVTDLRQVFENCRLYNEPYCPVYKCGENLEKFLNDKLCELNFNFDMCIRSKNEFYAAESAPANRTI